MVLFTPPRIAGRRKRSGKTVLEENPERVGEASRICKQRKRSKTVTNEQSSFPMFSSGNFWASVLLISSALPGRAAGAGMRRSPGKSGQGFFERNGRLF